MKTINLHKDKITSKWIISIDLVLFGIYDDEVEARNIIKTFIHLKELGFINSELEIENNNNEILKR